MTRRIVTKAQRATRPAGPGPDTNLGIGRAAIRQHRRDDQRTDLRAACVASIVGCRSTDVAKLGPEYDHLREMGTGRLLATFHRVTHARLAAAT